MLTEDQFKEQAKVLRCKVSRIKAVYSIEANSDGYLDDGDIKGKHDSQDRVKILFEGHRFWKVLRKNGVSEVKLKQAAIKFPNVLYKSWTKKNYKGGVKEWDRMSEAYKVCEYLGVHTKLALEAASYGSFQIMGENATMCGYPDAQAMLTAFNNGGEYEQLLAFVKFNKSKGLDVYLRAEPFMAKEYADGYNGTASALNNYAAKLLAADKKFSA